MSLQDAVTFVQALQKDPTLQKKVTSKEDGVRVGAEIGLKFTAEELSQAYGAQEGASSDGELSDDDLRKTSGGIRAR